MPIPTRALFVIGFSLLNLALALPTQGKQQLFEETVHARDSNPGLKPGSIQSKTSRQDHIADLPVSLLDLDDFESEESPLALPQPPILPFSETPVHPQTIPAEADGPGHATLLVADEQQDHFGTLKSRTSPVDNLDITTITKRDGFENLHNEFEKGNQRSDYPPLKRPKSPMDRYSYPHQHAPDRQNPPVQKSPSNVPSPSVQQDPVETELDWGYLGDFFKPKTDGDPDLYRRSSRREKQGSEEYEGSDLSWDLNVPSEFSQPTVDSDLIDQPDEGSPPTAKPTWYSYEDLASAYDPDEAGDVWSLEDNLRLPHRGSGRKPNFPID